MKKNVWILNHYAGNMFLVGGCRHYYMAKYLKESGYNPIVFCSNYDHFTGSNCIELAQKWSEKVENNTSVSYVFIRTRKYATNGIDRIRNMFDYYQGMLKLAKEYARISAPPDVIYASSVHPLALVAGIKIAKAFNVKCICEIRDLWPESIVAYSTKWSRDSLIMRILYSGEKWIYKKADSLIFLEDGDYKYIIDRGWERDIPKEKVFFISNGVDIEEFNKNKEKNKIFDEDLEDDTIFKVVYTGSIRQVNNLGSLLEIAKAVKNPQIRFLIWGRGDQLDELIKRRDEEEINNVLFKGYVDKKYVPYITSKASLNIVHNAPMELFKYGVSFNKIFDYMAAGKPILCDFSCPFNPVIMTGAGIDVKNTDPNTIGEAIEYCASMDQKTYEDFCERALHGSKNYDYRILTNKLINILEGSNTK